jgi:hypothetical protein
MGRKLDRRRRTKVAPESIAARKAGLVITLRRRDALVRQLDTAVMMWFLGFDPVSIHLLVMPAYHVLCDLGHKTGNRPDIHDFVGYSRFDTGYDWLRHASRDPEDIIDFPPRVNDFLMWVCTISHVAVIRVYDEAGDVIETHEHTGEFQRMVKDRICSRSKSKREQHASRELFHQKFSHSST